MGEKIIEEAKKVNLTELFYDLVFVFGISKITHIFKSLNEGIFSLKEIIIYTVVFVCFISVWNVQTVYMNRYGKHNLLHIIIMTVFQMPALVFMAACQFRYGGKLDSLYTGASMDCCHTISAIYLRLYAKQE